MKLTAWLTLASMIMYIWIFANVGKARIKHQVKAPSMDGPQEFLSANRVQVNTVEQMILFLPAMWLCAIFFGDLWAAIGGAVWIFGRILYALGYYKDPSKRGMGFGISSFATLALMIATIFGLLTR